jgi:FkbM family methyltransferase
VKWLYHQVVSLLLGWYGLDFSWYQTFYFRVVFAIPFIEPILQLVRTRKRAVAKFLFPKALEHVRPGDVVLDLGANVGSISSLFLSMGMMVHAYEPDSRCIALLRRRFSIYGYGRIHLHHKAVGSKTGTVRLNYGSLTTESNSIIPDKQGADASAGWEDVACLGILDVIQEHGYVPLIKMDVEGAEYDILETLLQPEHLDRFGVCLVEAHADRIPSLKHRQLELEKRIKELELTERVLVTWP